MAVRLRMHYLLRGSALGVLLCLLACGETAAPTAFAVELVTDYRAGHAFDEVRVRLTAAGSATAFEERAVPVDAALDFRPGRTVLEAEVDGRDRIGVHASLWLGSELIASRELEAVVGADDRVRVVISCPAGGPCWGSPDAGPPDAGPPDAGPPDQGTCDEATCDLGPCGPDGCAEDAGPDRPDYGVPGCDDPIPALPESLLPRCSTETYDCLSMGGDMTCFDMDTTPPEMGYDCFGCYQYQLLHCLQQDGCNAEVGDYLCCTAACDDDADCIMANCSDEVARVNDCLMATPPSSCAAVNDCFP